MSAPEATAVWVTRAQPGAQRTADALKALGFRPLIAPVLEVVPLSPALPEVMDGVVFTSRNGVHAFAALTERRDLTALCVGDATAQAARDAGFAGVLSAASDARGLRVLIGAQWPKTRPLFYAAPAEPSAPVADWLREDGFQVAAAAVYQTRAVAPKLTGDELAALRFVLLHSARAAEQVARVMAAISRGNRLDRLTFLCLSEAVEAALKMGFATAGEKPLPEGTESAISPFPDEASMLSLLKDLY